MSQSEAKPQRQSQVTAQINDLERELSQLHESIDGLSERLVSVLRQPSPDKEAKGIDSEELVVLAYTIQGDGGSVRTAKEKIDDLLSRLEL